MLHTCTRDHHYEVAEELVDAVRETCDLTRADVLVSIVSGVSSGRPQFYIWPMDLGLPVH